MLVERLTSLARCDLHQKIQDPPTPEQHLDGEDYPWVDEPDTFVKYPVTARSYPPLVQNLIIPPRVQDGLNPYNTSSI
jgi:hypothetical protein